MTGIPFDDWLRLGVTRFAIPPHDFWRLSLREWLILTRPTHVPLNRSNLENLIARWPDKI